MTLLCYFHLCHKSFMMYSHPALLPVHTTPPPPGYTSICRYREKGSNLSASYLMAAGGGGVLVWLLADEMDPIPTLYLCISPGPRLVMLGGA